MTTDDNTVNSQVVDSVASVVTLATGHAASQALGMLDAVLLESLGMSMYNAVNRQQSAGMISAAALTATCAKMLSTPLATGTPPAPPPPPGAPPDVRQLPGPPPSPPLPAAVIAAAMAEGRSAIQTLKDQALSASDDAANAADDLKSLQALAAVDSTAPPVASSNAPSAAAASVAPSGSAAAPAAAASSTAAATPAAAGAPVGPGSTSVTTMPASTSTAGGPA